MKSGPDTRNISRFIDDNLENDLTTSSEEVTAYAVTMANDLQSVSLKLFQNINPNDFHRLNTVGSEKQPAGPPLDSSSPVIQMSDMAKSLTSMVASDILLASDDAHRMRVFEFYVRVLEQAVKNGDYNTAFGISGGLVVNPVDRLKLKEQNPALAEVLEKNAVVHWTTRNYQQAINEKAQNGEVTVIPNIASAYIKVTATVAGNKESDVSKDEKINVIRSLTDQVINDHVRPFVAKAKNTEPSPITLKIHKKLHEPVLKEDTSGDNQNPDHGSFEERSYQIRPFGGKKPQKLASKEDVIIKKMSDDLKDYCTALYQKINPDELMYDTNKPREAIHAPNIVAATKEFNTIAATVRDNILLSDSADEFAEKYTQSAKLLQQSIKDKNYFGALAILSGMEHFSISRLASNNPEVAEATKIIKKCNNFLLADNGKHIKNAIAKNKGDAIAPTTIYQQQIDRTSQAYGINDTDSPKVKQTKQAKMDEISMKVQANFSAGFAKLPPIQLEKVAKLPHYDDPKLDDKACESRSLEIRSRQKDPKTQQNIGILYDEKRPPVTPAQDVIERLKAPITEVTSLNSISSNSATAAQPQAAAPAIDYATDPNHKGKERDEPAPTAAAPSAPEAEPKPVAAAPVAAKSSKHSREQRLLQSVLNHAFRKAPSAEELANHLEGGKATPVDKPTRTRGTVNVHARNGADGEILRFRVNKAENISALKTAFENEGIAFKTSRTRNHTVFEISSSEFAGKDKKFAQNLATGITMQRAHLVEVVAARQEAVPPDLSKLAAMLDAKPAQISAPLTSTNLAPAGFEPRARRQLATTIAVNASTELGAGLEISVEKPKAFVNAYNKNQQTSKTSINESSPLADKKGFFEQFSKKVDDAAPKTETKRGNKVP